MKAKLRIHPNIINNSRYRICLSRSIQKFACRLSDSIQVKQKTDSLKTLFAGKLSLNNLTCVDLPHVYSDIPPQANLHSTSGKNTSIAFNQGFRFLITILHKQFPVLGQLVFCLGTICLFFCGCEITPSSKGVFIKGKDKYIALKKFPLEIQIQNVKGGFVRTYHLKDETLEGAQTFYGRKHRFLINSTNEHFRILPVNQKVIVKYKYIRFKSYVHFSEVKINNIDKVSITGDHRFMEANFEPGRYVLVPWEGFSPSEPVSYGFIIQTSPPPAKTQPQKEKPNPNNSGITGPSPEP